MQQKKFVPIYLLAVALLVFGNYDCIAASSLTSGGKVLDTTDMISADDGTWLLYNSDDSIQLAEGFVGEFESGYWAGEVGAFLNNFAIDDELICIIEKETNPGTFQHKGYYAVMDHTLTNNDPAEFYDCTLREIPVPTVTIVGSDADISWSNALEDSPNINIVGYNVYRSNNGVNFVKINLDPVPGLIYTDSYFPPDTRYYAIGLVFRGSSPINGKIRSANSLSLAGNCESDFDEDFDVDGYDLSKYLLDSMGINIETFSMDFGRTDCP